MPHLAMVIVPHPVGGIDLQQVTGKAEEAMEDMVRVMSMPREELAERAKKQSLKQS